MFRSLINTFRFVGLFCLWAILGAASYLLVTSFFPTDHEIASSHGVSSNNPIPIIRDRELEAATVLFAQSENPVDLAFDHAGTGYLLDESEDPSLSVVLQLVLDLDNLLQVLPRHPCWGRF